MRGPASRAGTRGIATQDPPEVRQVAGPIVTVGQKAGQPRQAGITGSTLTISPGRGARHGPAEFNLGSGDRI